MTKELIMYGYDHEEEGEDEQYYYPQPPLLPPQRAVGGKQALVLAVVLALVALVAFGGISLPESTDDPPPAAAPPAVVAPTAECKAVPGKPKETVWSFLLGNGLNRAQAAGVMGNIQAESGFNSAVVERGSGIGYGLAQWSYGRRTSLEQAARDQKVPVSDICFQLRYLLGELRVRPTDEPEYKKWPTEWEALVRMPNEVEALVMFHHEFEWSKIMRLPTPEARRKAVIDQRMKFVHEALRDFPG